METEKLYYQDPYLTAFTARVLSCEKSKSGWAVVLDRTAFYPEGGGQPADHGTLGAVQVTDVHETKGVIFHTCDGPVEIGTQVAGAVDWPRRFDHMQQHSGEHILSGLLCSLYHCDNVGFHLGADTVTIDYNAELTWEQVMAAEKAANEVIWQDTPVDITFPAPDALARLNYRSKKALTGQVRIVAFPGADCCACCGTHVRRAGEVGIIKVLSCQKFREGARLEILCGSRAYRYLSQVYDPAAVCKTPGHPGRRRTAGGGAGRRQAADDGAGGSALLPPGPGPDRPGRSAAFGAPHAAGRSQKAGRRSRKGLRRSGGGVRGSGVLLRLCPCPGRWGGHLSPGEAAERRSFRPGWRAERLCPGQRAGGPDRHL